MDSWNSVLLLLCGFSISGVVSWSFAALNVSSEDVTVVHASVSVFRVFLSIKSDHPEVKIPTLVESIWPETVLSSSVQIYSSRRFHYLSSKPSSSCRKLVQSYRTAVDQKGNLFILDNGSKGSSCGPKLILMSFFNQEIQRKHFNGYPPDSFTDLILDTKTTTTMGISSSNSTRAYLSVRDRDFILLYSVVHNDIRRLKIQPSHVDVFSKPPPISISAMAMVSSRRGRRSGEVAYLYDSLDKSIYLVDLKVGRSQGQLYATQLGFLLGDTRKILLDPDNFLYYSMDRDGVLVRWNTRTKLIAESHEILHFQTASVAQTVIGPQGALFLVTEKPGDQFDLLHSHKILDHYSLAQKKDIGCSFCD